MFVIIAYVNTHTGKPNQPRYFLLELAAKTCYSEGSSQKRLDFRLKLAPGLNYNGYIHEGEDDIGTALVISACSSN